MNNLPDDHIDFDLGDNDGADLGFNADYNGGFNPNNNNETGRNASLLRYENEYEKNRGKLYKTFDVRFIKSKIWEGINMVYSLFIFFF